MGLFPASRKKTRTVFTFRLLEHFDVSNLEAKVPAYIYYNCLIRLTSNPSLRRRSGHPYVNPVGEIPAGQLGLFCAACPQPDINLLDDWKDDPEKWKYMPTLLADDNFKQHHLAMKHDFDNVALNDGLAYMVAHKRFQAYMSEAPTAKAAIRSHFPPLLLISISNTQTVISVWQSAIYDKRRKLQKRIDESHRDSSVYLPPLGDDSLHPNDRLDDSQWEFEDEDGSVSMPGS
ncbi:hypothetical protein QCA50_016971 [Cerrena zonata]|uniref:CxC2-like cysteine cluster KDZ transposase-associated domain-containing protein n=1 Tax=Cerrena zonata TaxID=2478898 RepID=A0AAW0FEM1_9APHY